MTFSELLEAHLSGMRGEARKRAKANFTAGAKAASAMIRDQLFTIDNPECAMNWEYTPAKLPRARKPQKRLPYFIVGKNKAA